MNKHLNNWLDEQEGKEPETSNNNIKKELKRQGYKCDGVHKSVNGIINCKDCDETLDSMDDVEN